MCILRLPSLKVKDGKVGVQRESFDLKACLAPAWSWAMCEIHQVFQVRFPLWLFPKCHCPQLCACMSPRTFRTGVLLLPYSMPSCTALLWNPEQCTSLVPRSSPDACWLSWLPGLSLLVHSCNVLLPGCCLVSSEPSLFILLDSSALSPQIAPC